MTLFDNSHLATPLLKDTTTCTAMLQPNLRDITGLVLDHCNKISIAIKQVFLLQEGLPSIY